MASPTQIADLRKDYSLRSLEESNVDHNPIEQFTLWWNEALQSMVEEPNAMTLATCDREGNPSARIVLLKGIGDAGFVFYTNYNSRKAEELLENPRACLVFFWKELERQVRIEGTVSKVSADESDKYFSSRPLLSRISAWSSPQSKVIANREILEKNVGSYQSKFADGNIPRPDNWGGYLVSPVIIEFWQGRESRLHDRIQYTLRGNIWVIERLAP